MLTAISQEKIPIIRSSFDKRFRLIGSEFDELSEKLGLAPDTHTQLCVRKQEYIRSIKICEIIKNERGY